MSEDSYTEVTNQSWFGRIGNAFKGIIVGIILIVIAFPLLFWNEGRAVKRYKTLKEGGGAVVSISADKVDQANEGRLVHLSGRAATEETLTDQTFGVSANAIKLRRTVEMYQWKEESKSEQKKKLGGSTETVTTYTYSQVWSDSLINSGSFKKPDGHQNPNQMKYSSEEQVAGEVTVGAFTLSPSLINKIREYTPVSLATNFTLPTELRETANVTSNTINIINQKYSAPQIGDVMLPVKEIHTEPQIGDLRVSFQEVRPLDISLVANQVGNTFEPYHAKAGGTIELLQNGIHAADTMFQQAQKSNTILTWVLRVVGFIIMLIGFQLILAPLSVFADVLPILGSIVGVGTGFIASMLAGVFSFLTVSIAWFIYRPILSVILIILAGGIGVLIYTKLKKATPVAPEAPAPPPPPPVS